MANSYKAITSIPGWAERLASSDNLSDTAQAYAYVPLVFRAVRLRADALRKVPVKILPLRGKVEREWMYPEPLSNLLWRASASLDLSGAAFWELVANEDGYRKDVKYRNPFDMAVKYQDGQLHFKQNSTGAEWINDPTTGTYQMIYFTEYDPAQDVLPGVGASRVALQNAKLLHYMTRFASAFFESGAQPVTLLGIDSTDKDEITKVESWVKRSATAVKNAWRVLGIRAGSIVPQQLTPPLKDLVMPDMNSQAARNVALAFGIPQTMLEDAANFATAKEHRLSFYEDTIQPRASLLEDVINSQLLKDDGLKIMFDFESMPIFQEDESDRAARLQTLTGAGVSLPIAAEMSGYPQDVIDKLTADEKRKQEIAESITDANPQDNPPEDPADEDKKRWQRKALKAIQSGKSANVPFTSEVIPADEMQSIRARLAECKTADDVRAVFTPVVDLAVELKRANDLLEQYAKDEPDGKHECQPDQHPPDGA